MSVGGTPDSIPTRSDEIRRLELRYQDLVQQATDARTFAEDLSRRADGAAQSMTTLGDAATRAGKDLLAYLARPEYKDE